MTTIHPLGLAKAIADDKTFELLDVRSRKEFERGHIRDARSAPLRALQAAGLCTNAVSRIRRRCFSFPTGSPAQVSPPECCERLDASIPWCWKVVCTYGKRRACRWSVRCAVMQPR